MCLAAGAHAQDYRFAIGLSGGLSGYLGCVNRSNMFRQPGFAAGAVFRYNINSRFHVKAMADVVTARGDSKFEKSEFPHGEEYSFKATVIDAGAQFEVNFLNYGIGSKYLRLKRISPYAGLGLAFAYSLNNVSNGAALIVPLSVGVKYKLNERMNLGLEWLFAQALTGHIDGLHDLTGIHSGFAKNKDFYTTITVSFTYEFSKRCKTCHYVD